MTATDIKEMVDCGDKKNGEKDYVERVNFGWRDVTNYPKPRANFLYL
jgi:hypothetical protein